MPLDDKAVDGEHPDDRTHSTSRTASPPACAVAGFALAVVALLGQNAFTVGVSTVLESALGLGNEAFYVGWGVAVAVQVGIALRLSRRALVAGPGGWVEILGRATVIVSALALVAGALVVLGGLLSDGAMGR